MRQTTKDMRFLLEMWGFNEDSVLLHNEIRVRSGGGAQFVDGKCFLFLKFFFIKDAWLRINIFPKLN